MPNRKWYIVSTACIAIVEFAVGILISRTVAIWMLAIAIPLLILSSWKIFRPQISVKKGTHKMLIGLAIAGIVVCIGGIIGLGFFINSQFESNVKTTTVYCCITNNVYQVWADNKGNDMETVIIKLGTSGLITDFKANMGASLPNIIEGGKNANFITFEIDRLPPDTSLTYLIPVALLAGDETKPRQFTAWSDVTKKNIPTKYLGECPKVTYIGPEETRP